MSKFLNIFAPALGGAVGVLGMSYLVADQFVVDLPAPLRGQLVQPAMADVPTQEESVSQEAEAANANVLVTPEGGFGIGRLALREEVAAWDTDVRPDGVGLPEGRGDVFTGEEIFLEKCASCHGDFAEGTGRWPVLAGGIGTLQSDRPVKTIGSYWPYLSTVYDYVNRAMPFGDARSLSSDEVYAITAYLLYSNDIVGDDFELSHENFLEVEMPNAAAFYLDDRADTEIGQFSTEPCMEDCKDAVTITARAAVLDVTPDDDAVEPMEVAATAPAIEETPSAEVALDTTSAVDPALFEQGERAFRQCQACHQVGGSARNRTGPVLNGVVGRQAGTLDFRYSNAMADAGAGGLVWDEAALSDFLTNPKTYLAGTKMSFRGVRDVADIPALIAYLKSFEE